MATSSESNRRKKKKVDPKVRPDLPHINNPNVAHDLTPNIAPNLAGDVAKDMARTGQNQALPGGRWTFSPNGSPIWVSNTPGESKTTLSGATGGSAASILSQYAWGGTNQPDETKRGTGDQVYMGVIHEGAGDHSGPRNPDVDRVITADQAKDDVYSWSEDRLFALGKQLYKAGLISKPDARSDIYQVWAGAVTLAGKYYAAGKKLTPWDVLQLKGFHVDGTGGNGSPYANQTLTETHKDTSYIDGATADAYTRSIFQETLGRDPTHDELSKYRILVTGYEKGHPAVSKSTVHYNAMGAAQDTTSETVQGPDAVGLQDQMKQQAKADPEYGAYQAATTYYNAIQDLINGR